MSTTYRFQPTYDQLHAAASWWAMQCFSGGQPLSDRVQGDAVALTAERRAKSPQEAIPETQKLLFVAHLMEVIGDLKYNDGYQIKIWSEYGGSEAVDRALELAGITAKVEQPVKTGTILSETMSGAPRVKVGREYIEIKPVPEAERKVLEDLIANSKTQSAPSTQVPIQSGVTAPQLAGQKTGIKSER